MKKSLLILLSVLLLLSLAACGNDKPSETKATEPKETTSVSGYESFGEYINVAKPVSWEAINAFPIKTPDMTIEEARTAAIEAVKKLSADVGIPADLKAIVKDEDVDFLSQSAMDDACRPGNPKDPTLEDIKALYRSLM